MTAGEVGRWPAPALPPALLSPPETAVHRGDRSQRSGWRGAGAHTPPPGAFAPHSRTTGDVARPARLRRSQGVRSFTFHFRESKCLVFEGALEKKRVVHTGDAEPLSPSGCPRLPGRRDHSVGGHPGQLPPGWARSRPKVPPRRPVLDRKWAVRSPGPLTGFGCAGQGGRRRGAQRELMDSMLTCHVRQSPGHGLGRRRGPEGQERRVVGLGTWDFLSGARGDWLQAGWAWGAMGRALASSSGADTMSPRVLPRPSVRVSASSSQTGLGTALGLHFTLVTSLKTLSTHSPVMRGGGASGAQVAPGDAVQPGTGHITRPEAPGLGQWGAQGHAGPFLGGRFSQEEVPGLRRQTGRPPTREGAGRSRGPPWGVGSPTTSYGAARLCG